MNIDIIHQIYTLCTILAPFALAYFGFLLFTWIIQRQRNKEELKINIYHRDMYRDIYKHYRNKMWNINRWLSNYEHSPSMIKRGLMKIESLEIAAENYKKLWEINEQAIPAKFR